MSAEEIQQLVDTIREDLTGPALLYAIMAAVLSGVVCFFASYLKQRGVNRAQKESIGEITDIVQSVKSRIDSIAKREEIHYNYYFQKKAEVLATAYSNLRAIHRDLKRAIEESLDTESTNNNWVKSRDALWQYSEYLDDNRIFIEESIEENIEEILRKLFNALHISRYRDKLSDTQAELKNQLFVGALSEVGDPMKKALDDLATSFRAHIAKPQLYTADALA